MKFYETLRLDFVIKTDRISMLIKTIEGARLSNVGERLKMRERKTRRRQKCRGGKHETGKRGTSV